MKWSAAVKMTHVTFQCWFSKSVEKQSGWVQSQFISPVNQRPELGVVWPGTYRGMSLRTKETTRPHTTWFSCLKVDWWGRMKKPERVFTNIFTNKWLISAASVSLNTLIWIWIQDQKHDTCWSSCSLMLWWWSEEDGWSFRKTTGRALSFLCLPSFTALHLLCLTGWSPPPTSLHLLPPPPHPCALPTSGPHGHQILVWIRDQRWPPGASVVSFLLSRARVGDWWCSWLGSNYSRP